MQLFVHTLSGKTITLEVDENITSKAVCNLIYEKVGYDIECQYLIVAGNRWKGNNTLSEMKGGGRLTSANVDLRCVFPKHLKGMSHFNFQEMKLFSPDLARYISMSTRKARYSLEDHPDTDYYWNHLDPFERYALLNSAECLQIIYEAHTKNAKPYSIM